MSLLRFDQSSHFPVLKLKYPVLVLKYSVLVLKYPFIILYFLTFSVERQIKFPYRRQTR